MKYLKQETDAIYRAYTEYERALEKLRAECTHKTILGVYEGWQDNRRICEDCGLEIKNPWGNSLRWGVLAGRAYNVSWEEFASARPVQTYIPSNE